MKKTILATVILTAVMVIAGCFTRESQEITNATIQDNILEVNFKFWVKGDKYSPYGRDYFGGIDILLNDKKIDFNWQKYPRLAEIVQQHNPTGIVIRGSLWGLSNYNDDVLYYKSDVSTGYSSSASFEFQKPTYVRMRFLLENTSITKPIKIELIKKSKTIDSIMVE